MYSVVKLKPTITSDKQLYIRGQYNLTNESPWVSVCMNLKIFVKVSLIIKRALDEIITSTGIFGNFKFI